MGQVANEYIKKKCMFSLLPGKDYLKPQKPPESYRNHQEGCRREAIQEQRRDQGRMAMGKRNLSTEPLTQFLKTLWARHSESIRRGH